MKIISAAITVFVAIIISCIFFLIPLFSKIPISDSQKKENIFLIKQGEKIKKNDEVYEHKYINYWIFAMDFFNLLNYGEFSLSKNDPQFMLLYKIFKNQRHVRKLYIPAGFNKIKLMKIINGAEKIFGPELSIQDIEDGWLFPDTYHYYYGQDRASIVKLMKSKTEKILKNLWEKRDPNLPYKNVKEALSAASVIQKEAILLEDKKGVSSVILNRLKIGMKLESDPTSQYANQLNNFFRIRSGLEPLPFDLKIPSLLNTYFATGLPAQPISNADYESIHAAFHPIASSKDLYFISLPGEKKLIFAQNYTDHLKNVAILRKKQKEARLKNKP